MKSSSIKKFAALREALQAEKAELVARLAELNAALGEAAAAAAPAARRAGAPKGPRGPRKRAKNEKSLREAVVEVIKSKPLNRQEILEAVQKNGYKFTAKDPLNSLSTLLYSNKVFKNVDGKFTVA
jgi:hypothetical protein